MVLSRAGDASGGEAGCEDKSLQKRDWSSAIDLVNEACEAVRLAEERASTAERYSQQLNQYYAEQVKGLELRLQTAEKRAERRKRASAEAEEWLIRFYNAMVGGFKACWSRIEDRPPHPFKRRDALDLVRIFRSWSRRSPIRAASS